MSVEAGGAPPLLQPCAPEAACGCSNWLNWGRPGCWAAVTFLTPSLFNFQAPQSKKPLLKKGSVLGSYLQDDKPVKRLDGPLSVSWSWCRSVPAGAPCRSVRVPCLVPRLGAVCLWEHGGDAARLEAEGAVSEHKHVVVAASARSSGGGAASNSS